MELTRPSLLELGLRAAAITQFGIALLNFSLVRIMKWKPELERLPLLIREVFQVHLIFISITVGTFAGLTWRFARDMATGANTMAIWLALAIGVFWGIRAVMQWTFYSRIHWQGDTVRTLLHWLLFFGYGAFAVVYLWAGILQA